MKRPRRTVTAPGFASLELKWEDVTLFRYIYDPDMPQAESPKPFFHPVNTLAGDLITNYRRMTMCGTRGSR